MQVCPHCHKSMTTSIEVPDIRCGPTTRRALTVLAQYPEGLLVAHLTDVVYADDPSGGPMDHRSVYHLLYRVKDRLAAAGWAVRPACGGGIRLVKDADTARGVDDVSVGTAELRE